MHDVRHSRPLATAAKLAEFAVDTSRFIDKQVLLTGEWATLSTANGRACLLDSLRLLVRICRQITIYLPPECSVLTEECRAIARHIVYDQEIHFPKIAPDASGFDAVLSVGIIARPHLPWTVINSHGWLARVSSGDRDLPSDCSQANPIGALGAASLGVTDVFKRLIQLRETRGRFFNGLLFSLYTYQTNISDPGPVLPPDFQGDVLMVGAGAIGNGIGYLLSQLPVRGHVDIVDTQLFQPENLGTCILIGPSDVDVPKPKAEAVAAVLRANGISANGYQSDFAPFSKGFGHTVPYPKVILNALDNVETRHQVQDVWPDLIIDGAIGDFGCQVSVHPWGRDIACLRCLFQAESVETAEKVASRATGLTEARVQHADDLLTEGDVNLASQEKQSWLRERIGRMICSVVQEAVAQELSIKEQRAGFRPSVPFVATLSASMVVGEFVKYQIGLKSSLEPRYQLDILRGPERGLEIPQERRRDCLCVTRAHNIALVRARR